MDHLCVHTAAFIGPGRSSVIDNLLLQHGASDMCACTSHGDAQEGTPYSHYIITCSENQQLVLYNTPHCSSLSKTGCLLEEISRSSKPSLNVIVVCIRVTLSSKPLDRSAHMLRVLHATFGQRVWRNVVFALTSVDWLLTSHDPWKLCNVLKEEVRKRICRDMLHGELKVPLEVTGGIAIVPVGFRSDVPSWHPRPKSSWVDHLRRSILRTAAASDCVLYGLQNATASERVNLSVSINSLTSMPQEAIKTTPMSCDPHQAMISHDPHQASVPLISHAIVPLMSRNLQHASVPLMISHASVPLMSHDFHQGSMTTTALFLLCSMMQEIKRVVQDSASA